MKTKQQAMDKLHGISDVWVSNLIEDIGIRVETYIGRAIVVDAGRVTVPDHVLQMIQREVEAAGWAISYLPGFSDQRDGTQNARFIIQ